MYDYNYDIDTVFGKDTTYNVTITPATVNVNTFDSVKTYQIHNFSSIISGIAVDPNNADNVVITLGGYGSGNHVYYSTNATSTNPTFNLKEGNLPDMPVYCALIDKNDANLVIIGTEYGVYLTENITASSPTWVEQNSGTLGNVPIYQITQQKFDNGFYGSVDSGVRNGGYIYIASHGRGIFKTESLKDPTFIPEIKPENADNTFVKPVHIYPNPVVDNANVAVNLNERTDVNIKVYNLFGKLILEDNYANQTAGEHIYRFSSETLANGTYLVSVKAGNEVSSSKFVVY
ncbi:MAG: hypothetical protein C0594_10840 [Marinilabiliales bacterium]|nr:MAG: hypothetical protein C0594_10840 [Marinilabiliales bacterium]